MIQGLSARGDLNGLRAKVVKWVEAKARYQVTVEESYVVPYGRIYGPYPYIRLLGPYTVYTVYGHAKYRPQSSLKIVIFLFLRLS